MKKRIVVLLLQIIFVVTLFSCKVKEPTATVAQLPPEEVIPLSLVPWKLTDDPSIEPGDPINFYNQFAFEIFLQIPNNVTVLQDGHFITLDSTRSIHISVDENRRCELINSIRDREGKLIGVDVHFDDIEIDGDDDGFDTKDWSDFAFFLLKSDINKTFVLEGTKLITFQGKQYPATVRMHGKGGGYNRLMRDDFIKDESKTIHKSAGDVSPHTWDESSKKEIIILKKEENPGES